MPRKTQRWRLAAPVVALMPAGCGNGGDGVWSLLWSSGSSLVVAGLVWAVGFGLVGLVVSVVVYWILRRTRALSCDGGWRPLVRILTLATLLVAFPFAFAYVGFFEGLLRASTYELYHGEIAREHYPVLGTVGADFVAGVVLEEEAKLGEPTDGRGPEALLQEFRNGETTLEASRVSRILASAQEETVRGVADDVRRRAKDSVALLREGRGEQLLDAFVDSCAAGLIADPEGSESRRSGRLARLFGGFLDRLPEAARRDGDSERLSHAELSAVIVESTLADGILRLVVRPFCRGQQIGMAAAFGGTALLVLLAVGGARALKRRLREPCRHGTRTSTPS